MPWRLDSVSGHDMKIWAEILSDPNPIHLDPEVSRSLGFGGKTVNQGPANLAYVINMLEMNFPAASISRLESKFLSSVFAGDAVTVEGQIVETNTCGVHEAIICDVVLKSNDDLVALEVRATLMLPKD